MIDPRQRQLDEDGFLVLPDLMSPRLLEEVRTRVDELLDAEGTSAGSEFKQEAGCRRLANLVNKGEVFQRIIAHEAVLPLVRYVLGDFKLSSLNVRSVLPHGTVRQPLHADMAAVADDQGYWVCNTLWMLDDFTDRNGPLRVVPGSHLLRQLPQDVLDDPSATHPRETQVTGRAGTVVVMNAHLWHGGLENTSDQPRTALHGFFCRYDKPQQQYQKALLSADVKESLTPKLRSLLALDDPVNDQLSSSNVQRSGFLN